MAKNDDLTFAQLCKATTSGKFLPVYILMGEEPYYIDHLSELIIENAITEDERDFNFTDFYGLDADVRAVINSCKRFPMMAQRQVIVVHEAQMMKELDLLHHYVEKPLDSTILIICYKGGKMKSPETLKAAKDSDKAVVFESKKLTERTIAPEITAYVEQAGLTIGQKAITMLKDFIGTDIANLHRSLDKLAIITQRGEITPEIIEANVGISKDYNNFELLNAIQQRNPEKAMRIINYFKRSPKDHAVIPTVGTLFSFFSKAIIYKTVKDRSAASLMKVIGTTSDYRLRMFDQEASAFSPRDCFFAIGWIRELDTKSKGIGSLQDEYDLLADTVLKIIYNRS